MPPKKTTKKKPAAKGKGKAKASPKKASPARRSASPSRGSAGGYSKFPFHNKTEKNPNPKPGYFYVPVLGHKGEGVVQVKPKAGSVHLYVTHGTSKLGKKTTRYSFKGVSAGGTKEDLVPAGKNIGIATSAAKAEMWEAKFGAAKPSVKKAAAKRGPRRSCADTPLEDYVSACEKRKKAARKRASAKKKALRE